MTAKQKRFVAEYLIDLNATQSAIRAGYSKKTANRIASHLLSKVDISDSIGKGQLHRAAKLELKAEEVIEGIRAAISRCEAPGDGFNPQAVLRGYELLGRHLAMFTDRTEASGPGRGPIPISLTPDEITTDQLEQLIGRKLKEAAKAADKT